MRHEKNPGPRTVRLPSNQRHEPQWQELSYQEQIWTRKYFYMAINPQQPFESGIQSGYIDQIVVGKRRNKYG